MSLPRLHLTKEQFLSLPEYSCSIPTGKTPGKRWRRLHGHFDPRSRLPKDDPRHIQERWQIGEYGEVDLEGNTIAINWYLPVIQVGG